MGKHSKISPKFIDRFSSILAMVLLGIFISINIPNSTIREPNTKIFSIADIQITNFYKVIQFYYNSGRWDKLQTAIDSFRDSKGDLIKEVILRPDKPISNAINNSEKVSYIKPDLIEETKISESISSYRVSYSFKDKTIKRFGLNLNCSEEDKKELFNSINIIDEQSVVKKEGTFYHEDYLNDSHYFFTYEISDMTKNFTVSFISYPSSTKRYSDQITPDLSVTATPPSYFQEKPIQVVLNDEKRGEGFRDSTVYTINSTVNAGICTKLTLSANPNIFLRRRAENLFSFHDYSELKKSFSYTEYEKNSFQREVTFHKGYIDYLGLRDYGNPFPRADCIGVESISSLH